MYHPAVAQKRVEEGIQLMRRQWPFFDPPERSLGEVEEWVGHLDELFDQEKGEMRRSLTEEEQEFVVGEVLRSKGDFRYWLERYPKIKTKDGTLERVRLLESQDIIIGKQGELELEAVEGRLGDGVLIILLKARQLGGSTLAELQINHRTIFYSNLTALIAGDVPTQSAYLFDMYERIYRNLPWWMKPKQTYWVKDQEMFFGDLDTLVSVASGKSVRGGDGVGLGKGQMGRGKTINLFHGSEISTWENAKQLSDSLEPAIPPSPRSWGVLESTARGRGNEFHRKWNLAVQGLGRWQPVFIPWYAEERTYRKPAPAGWVPGEDALAHAVKAEEVSAKWCGRTIRLDKDQLFWWTMKKAEFVAKGELNVFLAEYAAMPEEAFQNTGGSIFPVEVMHMQRQRARPLGGLVEMDLLTGPDEGSRF